MAFVGPHAASAARKPVAVVPMFAPVATENALSGLNRPALPNGTSSDAGTEIDFTMTVTAVPTKIDTTAFRPRA